MAPPPLLQWSVDYARFFNYPTLPPSSFSHTKFHPLPKSRTKSSGTWIPSSTPALLSLHNPILSLSLSSSTLEEHFVSTLHFSWPQVSCVSQCPIRGSRAVFMSYRDCSTKIQKFAVRFPSCDIAEEFLNAVKECSRDTTDITLPADDIVSNNSSPSELIASNGLYYSNFIHRFEEESSYEEPISTYIPKVPSSTYVPEVPISTYVPDVPALTFNSEQPECPVKPPFANNNESLFSGLPPSFTELLTNCAADTEKEKATVEEEDRDAIQNWEYFLDPSSHVLNSTDDTQLRSQIAKYMSDASFHDMLLKIEKVIDELGGDLSL